jgi:AcrR family transcriptional regulator
MAPKAWNQMAPSRDEQRRQKRMAVLLTGAKLFARNGFDGTTLDDIASELNVTKRTLYYYIRSKNDILHGCTHLALDYLEKVMAEIAAAGGTPLERIELLMRRYMSLAAEDHGFCLIVTQPDKIDAEYGEILRKGRARFDHALRALIQEGIDDGSIAPCEPRIAAAAMFGAFNWVLYWKGERSPESYDEITGLFLKFLETGLEAR